MYVYACIHRSMQATHMFSVVLGINAAFDRRGFRNALPSSIANLACSYHISIVFVLEWT